MRFSKFFSCAALATILCASLANAQQPQQPAQPALKVGVIDIGYIFENYTALQNTRNSIKSQLDQAQQTIDDRKNKIVQEVEQLRKLDENSPNFQQKQDQLAAEETRLKMDFVRQEKQFAEQEAEAIYRAYMEIQSMVKQWSEYNGLAVVIRYERIEMDPKKPQTVAIGIQQPIVHYDRNYDLTDPVLKELNNRSSAQAAPQSAARGSNVR